MNKPVAYRHWIVDEEFPEDSCWEYFDAPTGEDCKECHPLYNNSVKQLSNEEIYEIAKQCKSPWHSHAIEPLMFAKAIIKKLND